jgi:LEA14-like dessication related protein
MHRVVGVLIVLAVASGCALLQGLSGAVDQPRLTLQRASLTEVSADAATVELRYLLDNPYPVELPLTGASYQVELEGAPVVSGALPQGIRVAPHGRGEVLMTTHVAFMSALPALGSLFGKSTAHYRARGQVMVDSPAGPLAVDFADEGDVDLRRAVSCRF